MNDGRRVLLGVSGSIAAYKSAVLTSRLVEQGYEVRVVLTASATRFIGKHTFQGLTGRLCHVDLWEEPADDGSIGHLDLARWAEIMVVAPVTANTLARLALGLSDDLLGATALSLDSPLVLAPAMETRMWQHPATQAHVATLRQRGAHFVGPEEGRLASTKQGEGRMAEPETILARVEELLTGSQQLAGKAVLVSAGPTIESLDPVRYLGNRSSGTMGFAMASEAARRGANVNLVAGPSPLQPPPGVRVVHVETTEEMRQGLLAQAGDADVVVMAAAVADFRPQSYSEAKLKRNDDLTLSLVSNPDIAAELAQAAPHALHIGFALETADLVARARRKLRQKGQSLVVANELSERNQPLGGGKSTVTLVTAEEVKELPALDKRDIARVVWDAVTELLRRQPRQDAVGDEGRATPTRGPSQRRP